MAYQGREPNMEDAPYRQYKAPKKNKKKKETYEQLGLPIRLSKLHKSTQRVNETWHTTTTNTRNGIQLKS